MTYAKCGDAGCIHCNPDLHDWRSGHEPDPVAALVAQRDELRAALLDIMARWNRGPGSAYEFGVFMQQRVAEAIAKSEERTWT